MTVFNRKQVDHTKEYMFFGEPCNTARYDKMRYPKFDDFTEQQLSFFWRPQEITISQDINDFKNKLTEVERRIYISNLQYQTLLDSVQGRSPNQILLPIVSLPELENWIETWGFSETIHSRSYTYIMKNVFDDPSKILDEIMTTPAILKRASMVADYYEELEDLVLDKGASQHQRKIALFKCLVSVFALEGVRFYVSFACSYSFAERGLMEGSGKIIGLINRDEYLHQGAVHYILTRWLKGLDDPEMVQIAEDYKQSIYDIFKQTLDQEVEWVKYLFKDGDIPMLNEEVLTMYLKHITDKRLVDLGLDPMYDAPTNPLPWMDSYTQTGSTQVAPQEVEISSYAVGSVDMNTDLGDLSLDF